MSKYVLNESIFYDKSSNYVFFEEYTYVIPKKSGMILRGPNEYGVSIVYNPEIISREEAANIIRELCINHYNVDIKNVCGTIPLFD